MKKIKKEITSASDIHDLIYSAWFETIAVNKKIGEKND